MPAVMNAICDAMATRGVRTFDMPASPNRVWQALNSTPNQAEIKEGPTMDFDNSFEVPLPPDQAWKTLMDIERIAPCMPGAELTEIVDDKTFKGKVSVRLGPVALTFQGTATFEDIDDAVHTATVKAQGADAKGRGGANANVGFLLEPSDAGSSVKIHTDLQLSGSVAQYGGAPA